MGPGAVDRPPPGELDLAQAVRLLTGLLMVVWAYSWWLVTDLRAVAPVMSLLCLAVAFATLAIAAVPHSPGYWRRFDTALFVAIMVVSISWLAAQAGGHPFGSDEVAIGQASSNALLSGANPYARNLGPSLQPFNLSPHISTPLLDGTAVTSATYPALSFLLYAPLGALLGRGTAYGQVADVIAWAGTLVLLWRLLPATVRPIVVVIASLASYVALVREGTTDCLFLPFLCLALWRWDRFGEPEERSSARWIGPVMLGLACAVKQTPWLMAPFLVSAVALEAGARGRSWSRTGARYAGTAGAAFLVPNLPFLLLDPRSWVSGVLVPLARPLIPFGQGLVQVVATSGLGGGRLSLFTVAALCAEIAALLALVSLYPRTRRALPLLAVAPLALSTRSLPNYFADALPPLLIGAATVPWGRRTAAKGMRRWTARTAILAGAASVAAALFAVAAPPALSVRVLSAGTRDGPDGRPVTTITVVASSRAERPVRPSFVTLMGVEWTPGWRIAGGPASLDPQQTATYRLESGDYRIALERGQTFAVGALVPDPASVSVSAPATVATAPGAGSDATVPAR